MSRIFIATTLDNLCMGGIVGLSYKLFSTPSSELVRKTASRDPCLKEPIPCADVHPLKYHSCGARPDRYKDLAQCGGDALPPKNPSRNPW